MNANEYLQVGIKSSGIQGGIILREGRPGRKSRQTDKGKMMLKILALTAVLMVCEGTIPDRLYYRRAPLRFIFNNQGMRRPGTNWNYQIVNGRPVISGFPNSNSYVAFGLNPQTGQIEQTQIITQTRPGGPFINMVQNMLHIAGRFFGQLTGAFNNAVGGAVQTAGQFGQDLQDLTNPVISVTGVSQTAPQKEPVQQPTVVRPTPAVETITTPSVEVVPEQPKSEIPSAASTLDQAIISLQTFQTNIRASFQSYFESEEGEAALEKVNENVNWAVNKLQNLRESATEEVNSVLLSGQNTVKAALDNVENAVVSVAGTQGRDFIEPTRNELNKLFNEAYIVYETSVTTAGEISPAK